MADLSPRGAAERFGEQVACAPERPAAFGLASGRVLDSDLYRSAPHG